jgi:hypothetical protein
MATVNKDFRIKSGLIVEGANATVNGEDIITTGSNTDNLQEGTTNLYFTNQRALDAVGGDVSSSIATAINALSTSDIEEGSNLYFTDARALAATSAAYDGAGSAAGAQTNAETYAKNYADSLASNYDAAGSASAAQTAAQGYTDTAISNLVSGAPALLDTLNELAAAINDDASFASTIATQIGSKQDTLTAGTGITITGSTISVTSNTYDAYGAAATAESNANAYTDTTVANGNSTATPRYQAIELTAYRKEEATWNGIAANGTETVHSFSSTYGSAKYLVRVLSNGHSQTSEVLVVRDANNNIAISEYAIVYTSEAELATITATHDGTNTNLVVTATNGANGIEVITAATLLAYWD